MRNIRVIKANSVLVFDYPWEMSENLFNKIMNTIGSRVEHEYINKNNHLLQLGIDYFNNNLNWPYKIVMESKDDCYRFTSLALDDKAYDEGYILSLTGLEARKFLFDHFLSRPINLFKNFAYTDYWFFRIYDDLTSTDEENDKIDLETISHEFVSAILQTIAKIMSEAKSRESFNQFVYEHDFKFTEEGNIYDPESDTTIELTKFQ